MSEHSPTSIANVLSHDEVDDSDVDIAVEEQMEGENNNSSSNSTGTTSALRENIAKKGKNAYYYAHAHKATGPEWDGKIEPRLLSTSSSNLSSSSSVSIAGIPSSKAELMSKSNITNYAFLNEETKVKIYIDLPGVGNCQDTDIQLDYTNSSLCLTIKKYLPSYAVKDAVSENDDDQDDEMVASEDAAFNNDERINVAGNQGEDRCLAFAKLFGEIEKATLRKKTDKIILTLIKKEAKEWSSVIA